MRPLPAASLQDSITLHPGLGQGAKHTSWVQSEIVRYTGGYLWHEWVMGAAPQPHCHLTLLTGVS